MTTLEISNRAGTEALKALYDGYYDRIYAYCLHRLFRRTAAEDVSIAISQPEESLEIIQTEDLFWKQAIFSGDNLRWFEENYGHPFWLQWCLIGPDGRVIATADMKNGSLAEEISKALKALEK